MYSERTGPEGIGRILVGFSGINIPHIMSQLNKPDLPSRDKLFNTH